jgi:hypothetical protein
VKKRKYPVKANEAEFVTDGIKATALERVH